MTSEIVDLLFDMIESIQIEHRVVTNVLVNKHLVSLTSCDDHCFFPLLPLAFLLLHFGNEGNRCYKIIDFIRNKSRRKTISNIINRSF